MNGLSKSTPITTPEKWCKLQNVMLSLADACGFYFKLWLVKNCDSNSSDADVMVTE